MLKALTCGSDARDFQFTGRRNSCLLEFLL